MNEAPPARSRVLVLLFSVLRERIGASTLAVDLEDPVTTHALLERLAEAHPRIRATLPSIRVAVNQEYVGREHLVRAGDEVALITPVSGG
jgi:molybdopterin synthase sulfur carrier subunit